MAKKHLVAAVWLFSVFTAGLAAQAQKTILVPSPGITTIQQGVDAASTGDTVMVMPGTYPELVVIDGKEITVKSQAGPSQTFVTGLHGRVLSPPFDMKSQADFTVTNTASLATTISGFTISNSFEVSEAVVQDANGTGVALFHGGVTVMGNTFLDTSTALSVSAGAATFQSNTVTVLPSCDGGNVAVVVSDASNLQKAGVYTPLTVSGNTMTTACANGIGVLDVYATVPLQIDHNIFEGQDVAVHIQEGVGDVVIENNLIANGRNGAMEIDHANSDPPSDPPDTWILNNTLFHNLGSGNRDNSSTEVKITGTYSRIALIGNIISTQNGNALACDPLSPLAPGPPTPMIIQDNLFWNPGGPIAGSNVCPAPIGSYGNINADPRLVSSTDYHLTAASPAIDAATTGTGHLQSTDLDGKPRVLDGSGSGSPQVDMGAFEFTGIHDDDVTSLLLTSSAYYLPTANNVTLSAQLQDVSSGQGLGALPLTISQDGGAPTTVRTDSSGLATLAVSNLTAGVHAFTASFAGASFSGSNNVAPATAVVLYVYVLNGAPYEPTILTLASSGNPVNFGTPLTFTVTSYSTDRMEPGPIALSDGNTPLASVAIDSTGSGTYTTSSLAVGVHTITASFAGDPVHMPASVSLTQTVLPQADFTLSSSTPSITIKTEHHASLTLTVGSVGSFAGTVDLECDTLPPYASCTAANPSLHVAAGGSARTAMTIDTDAIRLYASTQQTWHDLGGIALAMLCPVTLLLRRKGRFPSRLTLIFVAAAIVTLSGCSGKYPGHTPPGTYVLPVTGTSTVNGMALTHTINIDLVVTP